MFSNYDSIANKNMVFGIKLMVNFDAESEFGVKIAKIGHFLSFLISGSPTPISVRLGADVTK